MQITANQPKIDAAHFAPENLSANKSLSEAQKIAEASKQFEAILLRQILEESQKPVIKSEYTEDSSVSGIYRDFVTNQLAESMAHSGGFGLAQTFERQLTHPAAPSGETLKNSHS